MKPIVKGRSYAMEEQGARASVRLTRSSLEARAAHATPGLDDVVAGDALIDTGSPVTFVSRKALAKLALTRVGYRKVVRTRSARPAVERATYLVNITFRTLPLQNVDVCAGNTPDSVVLLIGRDLLAQGVLTYNGPANTFSFELCA